MGFRDRVPVEPTGIVPGNVITGYPDIPCRLDNDGEEVQTVIYVYTPSPVATPLNWICDGLTRNWKQR